MTVPVLHVLAGANGAGKSTFVARVLQPITGLPFVNADEIAAQRWPGDEEAHAYDASRAAAAERDARLAGRRSFITETVFSHASKVGLIETALGAGYHVELHAILVPEDVTVARVAARIRAGGHTVPVDKIRARYRRLWNLVVEARGLVHRARFYDNSRSRPFVLVADYEHGRLVGPAHWPAWTPPVLLG